MGFVLAGSLLPGSAWALSRVAFYYGKDVPVQALRGYEIVVVEPGYGFNPRQFNTQHSQAFAYVSVGEVNPDRPYYARLTNTWVLGKNKTWGTAVMDEGNPDWRQFFLKEIIAPLWEQGFRGFFLDTLDSYQLFAQIPVEKQRQEQGLVDLIRAVKQRYPQAKIILNRGFEILPQVRRLVYAVAAESLFSAWNQATQEYVDVSPQDRAWLLARLQQAQGEGLPVIVIDYAAPNDPEKARAVAREIRKLGFIPWVADGGLSTVGVGTLQALPEKEKE